MNKVNTQMVEAIKNGKRFHLAETDLIIIGNDWVYKHCGMSIAEGKVGNPIAIRFRMEPGKMIASRLQALGVDVKVKGPYNFLSINGKYLIENMVYEFDGSKWVITDTNDTHLWDNVRYRGPGPYSFMKVVEKDGELVPYILTPTTTNHKPGEIIVVF